MINGAHPAGIPPGQVIVHRHQVDSAAGQCVQIEWQRGNKRLSFSGSHLGNLALVQDNSTNQLHIVRTLADGPFGGFAHGGESFRQELIEGGLLDLAAFLIIFDAFHFSGQALAECIRFCAQSFIAEGFKRLLKRIDLLHNIVGFFYFAFIGVAPKHFDKSLEHGKYLSGGL